ncbi:MAG: hypothetical protein QOG41_155 [Thermoleophilaceae bacterium]|nr:hypothetical protein [Thermoleophilaceae bacterium]MEA2387382.1 hypothetical protein [Thermoleophilaceae bacterium]
MASSGPPPGPSSNGRLPGRGAEGEPARATDRTQTALDLAQTALDADQTASDADQTASDLDQTVVESDQAASDRDEALAGTDQSAADRDQEAADRELALGPMDEARRRTHDLAQTARAENTASRDAVAGLRSEATADRLEAAARRDDIARLRDLSAEARDKAAAVRDRLSPRSAGGVADRAQAAVDRARAAKDRERAAADRKQAAIDRDHAQQALLETHIDELTGTYRRGVGNIALQAEINRARRADGRLVLAFVDVDGLKKLNDRDGHAAGDALLVDVVAVMRSKLRSYDPVVRFGGDEFVCMLADTDLDEARLRFAGIQAALAKLWEGCSISVGCARLEPDDTLRDLIARADASLYEARRSEQQL